MSRTRTSLHPSGVAPQVADALTDFARVFDTLRGTEVDRNRLRHVERVVVGGATVFLKRFHGIQWKNLWRLRATAPRARSQGEREFLIARELEDAGLRPGRPLAFGDETGGILGRERRSLFVSEELPGESYASLLAGASREEREGLRRRAAAALGRAFARGIVLPDLSLEHLFALRCGEVGIIDLHNGRIGRPTSREIARALSRLQRSVSALDPACTKVTLSERLRFLVSFLRCIEELPPPRRFLRRIAHRARPGYGDPARARRYADRSAKRARREADLVRRALADLDVGPFALDVPSGGGRFAPLLLEAGASRVLLADASVQMLGLVPRHPHAQRLAARAERLPLPDASVDSTLCMRFLHHLHPAAAAPVLAELARVTRRHLVLSFFHPLSLHGLQRRLRSLLGGRPQSRFSVTPRELARSLRPHGFVLRSALAESWLFHELWIAVFVREAASATAGGAPRP